MKTTLLFTFCAFLLACLSAFSGPSLSDPSAGKTAMYACPSGSVTIQGCVFEDTGCYFVSTINGRTIAVNLFSYPSVNPGDEVSVTGTFEVDFDCAPCTLDPTSLTVLGSCN